MIFRQLFEKDSSTYTYLLACGETGECVLIDLVIDTVERDMVVLRDLGLKLTYTLETHIHADHLTGAKNLPCADIGVHEGSAFKVGTIELHPLFTPGHKRTMRRMLVDGSGRLRQTRPEPDDLLPALKSPVGWMPF